jgi:predicted Rossmann fold flavoprotein
MLRPDMNWTHDVVVVGVGPAGMTAAYRAARGGCRVLALDRMGSPSRKLVLAGGGRCNLLPRAVDPSAFVTDSSRNALRKILLSWPLPEIRAFLERDLRLRLYEDRKTGRVFPVGGGEEVRRRFLAALRRAHVEVRSHATVRQIVPSAVVLRGGETIHARAIVLATGGRSYPKTGSDGTGFEIAHGLGHHVVDPYPALVALRGGPPRHHRLAGVSVPVTLTIGTGRSRVRVSDDFLFTHRGYSGPAVLDASHLAARAMQAGESLRIDVAWGGAAPEVWEARLTPSARTVARRLREFLPDRLVEVLLDELGQREVRLASLQRPDRSRLVQALGAYPLPWTACGGWNEAEVTGGGVALVDLDPRTLESRMVPGLHLCGELLDAFGRVGGNNLLWAFVTGKVAGDGAVRITRSSTENRGPMTHKKV